MTIKYQVAVAGTGAYGDYMGLDETMAYLKSKIPGTHGIRLRKGVTNNEGPPLTAFEAFKRSRAYLSNAAPGDKLTLFPQAKNGPADLVVRAANYDPVPSEFLSGVPSIDTIATAVYTKYNDTYGIVDLGICVDKPGEHGVCNAVDIGVHKPTSSTAIHVAILDIANYLRGQMLADIQGEPGLPINGIIVMEQWCSRDSTNWSPYSGIPHVSHVHVSGFPNLVPGWI